MVQKTPKSKTRRDTTYINALIRMVTELDFDGAQKAVRGLGETSAPLAVGPLVQLLKNTGRLRKAAIAALKKLSLENENAATELSLALMQEKQESNLGSTLEADRRRSPRVLLEIPVMVRWEDESGRAFVEPSATRLVNAYGALLELKHLPRVGRRVTLTNTISGVVTEARVVWAGARTAHGTNEVAIELADPAPDFWVGERH